MSRTNKERVLLIADALGGLCDKVVFVGGSGISLGFHSGRQVKIVLFTKVTPNEDVRNSILPQKVIELCSNTD